MCLYLYQTWYVFWCNIYQLARLLWGSHTWTVETCFFNWKRDENIATILAATWHILQVLHIDMCNDVLTVTAQASRCRTRIYIDDTNQQPNGDGQICHMPYIVPLLLISTYWYCRIMYTCMNRSSFKFHLIDRSWFMQRWRTYTRDY